MSHDNENLSAGRPVRAVDFPPSQFNFNQTSQLNISSTTYVDGDPETSVRFMAPSSGRVAVTIKALVQKNGVLNADRVFVTYRVYKGDPNDGNLFQTDEVKYGISNTAVTAATEFQYSSHTSMVGGLEPGAFYFARVRHRVTIGGANASADVAYRHILVFPIP